VVALLQRLAARSRVGAALLLAACSMGAGAAEPWPLGLGVSHGPVSLLIYVAESLRLFEQEGLAIRRMKCESGRECLQRLRAGDVDVATAADFAVALDSLSGGDSAIIGTISSSARQIKLIARRGPELQSPAQLAGRRVGTVRASSAEYFLHSWLLHHGVAPEDVRMVYLPPDRLVAGLTRRDVDALAIWEPIAGDARRALRDGALELPVPLVYTQHFNVVAARRVLEDRAREPALLALLRALRRAEQAVADDPVRAQQVLSAALNIPPDEAARLMAEHDHRLRLEQSLMNTLRGQGRWIQREGLGTAPAAHDALGRAVEPALLRGLAPSAVSVTR
jgi:ABC-type nitrate/sulfonate/bicarbonate transport system substrate-binding protein